MPPFLPLNAAKGTLMRIAISGTYSSGKTTTSIALSHLTGIPRTHAKTMREILPEAIPGRRLEDCTAPELVQLGMRRYVERAVHESHLPDGYISDGSALHEWAYGTIRVLTGINPNVTTGLDELQASTEHQFFGEVMSNIGSVVKQHSKGAYDVFIHLPVEFPLVVDGHRPVSEAFREMSDELLRRTVGELGTPCHVIGGDLSTRLTTIVQILGLPVASGIDDSIERAQREVAGIHTADELARKAMT